MSEKNIKEFGKIVKASRDSGANVFSVFKERKPKKPNDEELSILNILNNSSGEDLEHIEKAVKYCVEQSLYKLLHSLEYGVGDVTFDLSIKKAGNSFSLINEEDDNELSTYRFFEWLE